MIDLQMDYHLIFLIVKIATILVVSGIIVKIFNRFVVRVSEQKLKIQRGRLIYVNRLFQLIIYSIAGILILWAFNIDVTGVIAGLGVGALIIGFALKDIIENWVSGLLIISGRTYRIGDVIKVGDFTGMVTDISLRSTRLKTYDRNDVIIPNSLQLKDRIINLTSGKREAVASLITTIDYVFNVEKVKKVIEDVLRAHPHVVVDENKRREIRFVIRIRDWTTEIESLFWINEPENEVFIKSTITETIKRRLEEEKILPPIPSIIRRDFLPSKMSDAVIQPTIEGE